ncbi:hypothetical protein I215_12818 [Galbibacter marinus]|uniref:Chromosome segregation protein n=1 Tax=Galbibacter marinus TaxID=555500 RepID=K2QI29_9FLAO|nr:DUF349 domain-containing protein [Galbibacter marinus]EKF54362.1 hypothetical protein I215_12818 [Galbibacter marinus]
MLDEKNDNLQDADGEKNQETTVESTSQPQETQQDQPANEPENAADLPEQKTEDDDAHTEIDQSNAEDAEDEGNKDRHEIPLLDYHAMSMEKLVEELDKLVNKQRVQAIKTHVDQIKSEFDLKYQDLYEQKKDDFIENGGNEIDFYYVSPAKKEFNEIYGTYREKRNQYYKSLEERLNNNLENRQQIIEELKGLINVEENINDTYKHFKNLQDRWRNAGPIPRVQYNDVWRTYHHHVERFYDFLDLNRELRDLDFKKNLEEKLKIIEQAEALAEIPDANKAFRELQILHKIWKEDLGPVDREHRENIWERFSAATKTIHHKRQEYFKNQDEIHEVNLAAKQEIIKKIKAITERPPHNHGGWQKLIKEIEALREEFFNAGRVPYKDNERTWSEFKGAVRRFNRSKNEYYKSLKKSQHVNLEKKMELVKIAEQNKDSEDFDQTTPLMKRIQADWKKIGHVPRKYSDKIWNEFKSACNHYFNRLHEAKNEYIKDELQAFEKKQNFMDSLKGYQLSGDKEKDLEQIKSFIADWKSIGRVPKNKKNIEGKFNKVLDGLFKKLNLGKQKSELIKYGNKVDQLANSDNENLIQNERIFIRRKIDEVKSEIRQLENNLQFINADDNNPIVMDVRKNIQKHHEDLDLWKAKLKEIKNISLD